MQHRGPLLARLGASEGVQGSQRRHKLRTAPHAAPCGPMGSRARTITRTRAHKIAPLNIIIYKDAAK